MTDQLHDSLRWLKNVAGVDDDYIARWPKEAWVEWDKAMRADRHGLNPTVPAWMQPILGPWHWDFSGPFPSIAQLWPTAHNWFAETETHFDFTLTVEGALDEEPPSLDQLREAWDLAQTHGATPLMNVSLVPAEPWGSAVAGEVEAFYVIGGPLAPRLLTELARIFGHEGATFTVTAGDAAQLLAHAGSPAIDGSELRAWEWMYG